MLFSICQKNKYVMGWNLNHLVAQEVKNLPAVWELGIDL